MGTAWSSRCAQEWRLLHLCADREWAAVRHDDEYRPASLEHEGYVHLSTPEQVHLPANRLFAGRTDLVLLCVDDRLLNAPLKWEAGCETDPAGMLFPHLYGPIPVAAVVAVTEFRPDSDGRFPRFQPPERST